MKKLAVFALAGLLILGLTACSGPAEKQPISAPSEATARQDSQTVADVISTAPPMHAISLPTVKETVTADDGTVLFSLSFQQAQVFLQNTLTEEKIINQLQARTGSILPDADLISAQAQLDYTGNEYWSEYFIDIAYTPTRLDHAVLSLFGNSSSYSGGPHPSLTTDSVNFDLQSGEVLFLEDILTTQCNPSSLYQMVLNSLAGQENDLYYDYADALGDRFTGELHNIQDWYFSRSGLCFHFAPYDIAPYSSGTIIAELPYSTLEGILDPKYFPAEASKANGSMYAITAPSEYSERFAHLLPVCLQENGTEIFLYPDATVTDVRIESGFRYPDSNQYISTSTLFAASAVNVGDAVQLTADLSNEDSILRLIYHSGDQEYSTFIVYNADDHTVTLSH